MGRWPKFKLQQEPDLKVKKKYLSYRAFTVGIPEGYADKIREIAQMKNTNMSWVMTKILAEYFRRDIWFNCGCCENRNLDGTCSKIFQSNKSFTINFTPDNMWFCADFEPIVKDFE